jgi:5-methylcytosine-specific restriction endonuclease McrA
MLNPFRKKVPREELFAKITELENTISILKQNEIKYKYNINELESNINSIKIKDLMHFNLKLPNFQRPPDETHINNIYQSYKKNINDDIKHAIYLGICNQDIIPTYYILDGSHRIKALKKLYSEGLIKEQKIECIYIEKNSMIELKEEFKSINNNMPLSKVYKEYCDDSDNNDDDEYDKIYILDKIKNYFYKKYPTNFEPTYKKGMRRPKILKTEFENNIYDFFDYFIEQNNENNKVYTNEFLINKIINEIINLNELYSTKKSSFFPMKGKRNHTDMLKRIKKNKTQMFLGMFPSGVWLTHLKEGVDDDIKSFNSLKDKVWDLYIGKDNKSAKCLCCNDAESKIKKSSFHFGHIHPQSKNGVTNIFNCIPICQSCNTKMGNMLLFDYMHNNNYNTNNPLFDLLKKTYIERGDLFKKIN